MHYDRFKRREMFASHMAYQGKDLVIHQYRCENLKSGTTDLICRGRNCLWWWVKNFEKYTGDVDWIMSPWHNLDNQFSRQHGISLLT